MHPNKHAFTAKAVWADFAIWCLCWQNVMFFFQEHLAACSPCDCYEPCGSFDWCVCCAWGNSSRHNTEYLQPNQHARMLDVLQLAVGVVALWTVARCKTSLYGWDSWMQAFAIIASRFTSLYFLMIMKVLVFRVGSWNLMMMMMNQWAVCHVLVTVEFDDWLTVWLTHIVTYLQETSSALTAGEV